MSRRILSAASFVVVTALVASLAAEARADAPHASTTPSTAEPAAPGPSAASESATAAGPARARTVGEAADARPADDPFRSLALTLNPLSLLLTRIGVNVEWLPTAHHAIVLNPFGQFASAGEEGQLGGKTSYTNFGAELGYRFYTGTRGANGFFVGPFTTLLSSNSTTTMTANGTKTESSSSFFAYGAGLDLGGQHVLKNGITLGAGLGLMYLAASASGGASSSTIKFEGVLPRLLFTAGYSF